jgi:AraC-like DNA-binding protein
MPRAHDTAVMNDTSFGLAAWSGQPLAMGAAHRHNDVELNYLARGSVAYLFGGQRVMLSAGDLCLFWAARPHQLISGDGDPLMYWVTLPLGRFLSWQLPDRLGEPVLQGAPLTSQRLADNAHGRCQIMRWGEDLALGGAERQQIVCLELEAFLRRFALGLGAGDEQRERGPERRHSSAEQMADYIVAHYTRPLTVVEVAASVGLHPHYAMQLFRQSYGVSLITYLTQYRVAHAQQLLATSDLGVLEIGHAAGFSSATRFYSAFKAACGVSPGAYRASLSVKRGT